MAPIVRKFGGGSVADAQKMQNIYCNISQRPNYPKGTCGGIFAYF